MVTFSHHFLSKETLKQDKTEEIHFLGLTDTIRLSGSKLYQLQK